MKMKFIILIIFIFTINSFSLNSTDIFAIINIVKSESGYDIYNEDGELLLEFTNINCNVKELNLLKFIYESTKEKNEFITLYPTNKGYIIHTDNGSMLLVFTYDYDKEKLDLIKYIYDVYFEYKEELKKILRNKLLFIPCACQELLLTERHNTPKVHTARGK